MQWRNVVVGAALVTVGAVGAQLLPARAQEGRGTVTQVTREQRNYFCSFTATMVRWFSLDWPLGWQLEYGMELVYVHWPEELQDKSAGERYLAWLMTFTEAYDPEVMSSWERGEMADLFEADARPWELPGPPVRRDYPTREPRPRVDEGREAGRPPRMND